MTPLCQRMIDDVQLRNLAAGTQKHYIRLVTGFAKYFGISPEFLDIRPSANINSTSSTNASCPPNPSTSALPP